MNKLVEVIANFLALVGVLFCLVSGGSRLVGLFYVAGFEAVTLLNAGIALMVLSVVLKIELIYRK